MRRPEVELSDEAARFVEQHPDVVEELAAQGPETDAGVTAEQRARFRGYVRGKLAFVGSSDATAAGESWLSEHGLTGLQAR